MGINPTLPKFTGETYVCFWFSRKNINLYILKDKMTFNMHIIIFFPPPKKTIKKMWVPILPKIFSPVTQTTHIFYLALGLIATFNFSQKWPQKGHADCDM